MRTFITIALLAWLGAGGCKKPTYAPPKPTERIGGVISQIHDKVDETVIMEMIKDGHLYILQEETGGQMPTPEMIREYGKKTNKKLGELLDKGVIAIPDKLTRGGVWL